MVRHVLVNRVAASWRVRSKRQRENGKISRSSFSSSNYAFKLRIQETEGTTLLAACRPRKKFVFPRERKHAGLPHTSSPGSGSTGCAPRRKTPTAFLTCETTPPSASAGSASASSKACGAKWSATARALAPFACSLGAEASLLCLTLADAVVVPLVDRPPFA